MEYCSNTEKSNNKDPTEEQHEISKDIDLHLDMETKESPTTKSNCEFTRDGEEIVSSISYEGTSMESFIKNVQPELECYISGTTKIGEDSNKDEVLIETVSRIAKIFADDHKAASGFEGLNEIFERIMGSMEDELRKILEEEEDDDDFPSESICRMKVIARVMVRGGYETECSQVYTLLRRGALKVAMKKSGYQKLKPEEIQDMSWPELETYISSWTKVVRHTAVVLFPSEEHLCNEVFSYDPCVGQAIITNLARSIIIIFLNFVQEATSVKKLEPEKVFKFLEIYDALGHLLTMPPAATTSEISVEQKRLGDSVIDIFDNLEISIMNDATTHPIPNGGVHPLTRYTMNYLRYACDFKDTLDQIFKDNCSYATKLARIVECLDTNLDAKSVLYKDQSLRYVFLMNNGRYMLRKIKESTEMRELVGETWRRKRSTTLRVYHKNYQRETWGKVLQCLNHQGIQVQGKVSKTLLKERIRTFNQLFEGIHKTQAAWLVSDEQLLSELRVSISAVVIPAYRSFLGTFNQHFVQGKERDKYVKFYPEDIETTIDELFDGKLNSSTRIRK